MIKKTFVHSWQLFYCGFSRLGYPKYKHPKRFSRKGAKAQRVELFICLFVELLMVVWFVGLLVSRKDAKAQRGFFHKWFSRKGA